MQPLVHTHLCEQRCRPMIARFRANPVDLRVDVLDHLAKLRHQRLCVPRYTGYMLHAAPRERSVRKPLHGAADHDGHPFAKPCAHAVDHTRPVQIGQHRVDHQDVRRQPFACRQRSVTARRELHVAAVAKRLADVLRHAAVAHGAQYMDSLHPFALLMPRLPCAPAPSCGRSARASTQCTCHSPACCHSDRRASPRR